MSNKLNVPERCVFFSLFITNAEKNDTTTPIKHDPKKIITNCNINLPNKMYIFSSALPPKMLNNTMDTASFNTDSPNTNEYKNGSTFKSKNNANVATGSVAPNNVPNCSDCGSDKFNDPSPTGGSAVMNV